MQSPRVFAAAGMSAALFTAIGLASPALAGIANGSFEGPTVPGLYTTYPMTPSTFGWTVYTGTVDHGRHPGATDCQAGPLTQCVDLNGHEPGGIKQSIATVAGQKYRVSFYMSRHRQLILAPITATMDARIDGNVVTSFAHSVTDGTSASDGGWQPKHFDFTATTALTELAFVSTTLQGMRGPQIDNVSITALAVPFDIAVKKQHDGHVYSVAVTNPGHALPVGAKIQIVDVVPQGLVLTVAASNLPWVCAPTGTIVGPDSITCTYSVTSAIPANGSLPTIHFLAAPSSVSDCPNCVRARLYVPLVFPTGSASISAKLRTAAPMGNVPKGYALASESNLPNNVSCVK